MFLRVLSQFTVEIDRKPDRDWNSWCCSRHIFKCNWHDDTISHSQPVVDIRLHSVSTHASI
jgi:hypothetical protein